MLSEITSEQLAEWWIFATRFQALPASREETALIVSTLHNLWGGRKTKPSDFNPIDRTLRQQQTSAEHLEIMRAFMVRHNAQCR